MSTEFVPASRCGLEIAYLIGINLGITPSVDLALGPISILGANINANDGLLIIPIGVQTKIDVPVSISYVGNIPSAVLNASVPLTLQVGSYSQTQNIPIASLVANQNQMLVPFWVTFQSSDVGLKTFVANMNTAGAISESNFSNNEARLNVRVGDKKYKIIKDVLYNSQSYADFGGLIDVEPSTLNKPSTNICAGKRAAEVVTIKLKCVSTTNDIIFEPAAGCTMEALLSLSATAENAHSFMHDQSQRPLGKFYNNFDPNKLDVTNKIFTLPVEGLVFKYVTSGFSGVYDLNFRAADPHNNFFDVVAINFRTKIPNLVPVSSLPVFVNIDKDRIPKHPNDGHFVTGEMGTILTKALNEYYQALKIVPNIPQSAITAINSEGASLYWGGRFDIHANWKGSHVCHREGEEMDIGLSNFIGAFGADKRRLLDDNLTDDNRFYYPVAHESPNPDPNDSRPVTHWHIRLKK